MSQQLELETLVQDFANWRRAKTTRGSKIPFFAEKLQTAAIRGPLNSRMKDYYDLWFLIESGQLSLETLKAAITATFAHRKTPLDTLPLAFSDSEIQTLQSYWSAFLRGLKSKEGIPLFVKVVIERLNGEMTRLGIGTV